MTVPSALPALLRWVKQSELSPGDGLPAERVLASELGIGRSELRKALSVLEIQGKISRRVGRGTFLSHATADVVDLTSLGDRTNPVDILHTRFILEPELARLAATRATAREMSEMKRADTQMRAAKDWVEYEEHDARLHKLIAAAAGNGFLIEIMELIYSVRRTMVWGRLATRPKGPKPDYVSFAEHEAILTAIENRDSNEAADAMRHHLLSTLRRIQEVDVRFHASVPTSDALPRRPRRGVRV